MKKAERFRDRVSVACCFVVMSLMVYGVFCYPHAPIKFRDGRYLDKTGAEFPAQQFRAYQIWERALYASFGGTAFTLFGVWLFTRTRKGLVDGPNSPLTLEHPDAIIDSTNRKSYVTTDCSAN